MEKSMLLHSPERPNSVKVTYLDRTKRKRSFTSCTEGLSDSEPRNIGTMQNKPNSAPSRGHKRSLSSMPPPPLGKGPQKIGTHLSGPSPTKRARHNSADLQDGVKDSQGNALLHCRTSISLAGHVPSQEDSPTKNAKIVKSQPLKQSVTPDLENEDDSISVAESSKGSAGTRRTQSERIQIFTEHPECGSIEPHRVFCNKCNKWVNTGRQQTYAIRPWEKHRGRCDKSTQPAQSPKAGCALEEEPDDDEDDAASTVAPSVQSERSSIRRTESERQALLESDPRAEAVKPAEVLCKKCQRWIKLSGKNRFVLSNWNGHQQRCSGTVPSSRIATAERKLRIVNDSQAKAFTARSVECAACETNILLDGDYDLTKWEDHKMQCSIASSLKAPRIPPPNVAKLKRELTAASSISTDQSFKSASSTPTIQPTPSSTSTNGTLIASDQSLTTSQGLKRSSEAGDEEERSHKRPRVNNYKPIEKEGPGPLGWFLHPFRTFVRGFREGLRS